ncbi:hypothetical protein QBC42DRAFT_348275 [Cladorrhinum samala]|uniref:Uncharacterized protein n=1 Tax=Cladorrhinum samala TaxID=585594 RepID=A0AAV9HKA4_9PEZI|nr:hypothetical protein QBC42DRAFT_348275 [Cladorrhinum samala]
MEYQPNTSSITSESAPLIEPVDSASDQDLFMVPLKRPSPRLPPSRYRNVKPRSPPRSPAAISKRSSPKPSHDHHQFAAMAYHTPPLTGDDATMKPFESARPIYRPSNSTTFSPQLGGSGGGGATSSMIYNSPPMSTGNMPNFQSTACGGGGGGVMSPDMSGSQRSHRSGAPKSSSTSEDHHEAGTGTTATRTSASPRQPLSTKASSVYDSPPPTAAAAPSKLDSNLDPVRPAPAAPEIPPLSSLRILNNKLKSSPSSSLKPAPLQVLSSPTTGHLAPPVDTNWTVPDSPFERLSQLRATRDSAYDRALEMEIRRSEWKHVVYRFPVKGKGHRVIENDLTESSHARLADVARRSSEGFEGNGEYELADIYRVLSMAHLQLMGEMRVERVGDSNGGNREGLMERLGLGGGGSASTGRQGGRRGALVA